MLIKLIASSRPLTAGSQTVPTVSMSCDQLGHARIAESVYRKNLCHYSNPKSMPYFFILVILALLFLCNAVMINASPTASGSLSFFALNMNGFIHPTKIDATNKVISHRNPDIFVISETKTNSLRSSKLAYTNYQIFEEHGIPVHGHHLFKWGIVLGIKKGITVSQRVPIVHLALLGRLIVIDIIIPLDSGLGFTHHIFAAYAPWNVTDNSETAAFWTEAAKMCLNTPNSWTLVGDLNAMVTHAKHKNGGTDAHIHFNTFLHSTKAVDLWSSNPECSRLTDWTCKPHLSTDGGSIINRIVVFTGCLLDSEIYVADCQGTYLWSSPGMLSYYSFTISTIVLCRLPHPSSLILP